MRTVRCSGHGGGVSAHPGCLPREGVSRGVHRPPVDRILDARLWKHYLSATTVADGNNQNTARDKGAYLLISEKRFYGIASNANHH